MGLVTDCPYAVVVRKYRDALKQFCRDSTYWRQDVTFNTVADQAVYVAATDFTAPSYGVLSETFDGTLDGDTTGLKFKTPGQLATIFGPGWRTETGQPEYFTHDGDKNAITLVPYPGAVYAVVIPAAWKPSEVNPETFPDDVMEDYHEEIAQGALARIFAMPLKPWTDLALAASYGGLFADGIQHAKRRIENAFAKPVRQVKYGGI